MAIETTAPLWRTLAEADPEIAGAIREELHRQNSGLELIAPENFVSRAILEAAGSVFTNKYAEGYPGRRYYGGCEWVDVVERAAIARAKGLFGAEHANVQPHSGAQANMAVYFALLKPGDTVLGMSLAALNQKPDACRAYTRVQRDFPNAPQSVKDRLTAERQRAGCT